MNETEKKLAIANFLQDEKNQERDIRDVVDVCIVGGGHAGCEAALAAARNGLSTVMFTVSVDSIALMPCNPNVGGSSKGHLVRELDALGGEMGKNIDKTFIQSKMLNRSKGPAVHSLRAQADKQAYTRSMRKVLENTEHLVIKQAEVCELLTEDIGAADPATVNGVAGEKEQTAKQQSAKQRIIGVRIGSGGVYLCKAVVLATGTYLNARCLCGEMITYTGPNGLMAATHLTDSLIAHGIEVQRFKTGTPARMDRRSLDFSKMEIQYGDEEITPFSFSTDPAAAQIDQVPCYLTYTNEETHKIIRENLDRSPIYAGIIEGTGPRYCPSIEDKVVKFPDKPRHQLFIEPEGLYTNEMYVSGMSSSMPEDVQLAMYRTVPGMEHCTIVRNAYAIEYDCIKATQLHHTLGFKKIDGLYGAGQINGSSGYEEAAAQGLLAGINAAMYCLGKEPVTLDRSDGYLGVLVDDLVTKETREPYRMMTSRAEYRLLLRQDNADLRLREKGHQAGLVSEEELEYCREKQRIIDAEVERLQNTMIGAGPKVQAFLERMESVPIKTAMSLAELMCRPELSYEKIAEIDVDRPFYTIEYKPEFQIVENRVCRQAGKDAQGGFALEHRFVDRRFISEHENAEITGLEKVADESADQRENINQESGQRADLRSVLPADIITQIDITIKYEGYIRRQKKQVESFRKLEHKVIPAQLDYDDVGSLRLEARQKLKAMRPENIGQASRISGVSPADISVLLIYLESYYRKM
ncbi:MAG: tRNA uridine-5-carboxymethylaminomethyl(34) synthesis enzyme MnmG [Lachnospiraceae bacterium]|nr:tRNA uridine-5-carboxymethylaminomethyl(34) synthesis enzyme MnmG [Lachnospiraceae bacterium]